MTKKPARSPVKAKRSTTVRAPSVVQPQLPLAVLTNVLRSVPPATRDGFLRAVTSDAPNTLDDSLWGSAPTERELQEGALHTLRRQYQARHGVLSSSVTRKEAAHLLGTSEQAVTDRLEAHDLVGLKQGREWRLPAWQFDPDAERGYLPGLAQIYAVFPGGPVSLTEWVNVPMPELDGDTPAAALAAGRVKEVVRVAEFGLAAAW